MENDFKTVTNAKGIEIPKYPKDFKKLLKRWSRESVGFWILSKVKTCFINQSQVVIMQKENKKITCSNFDQGEQATG